ncbi:MAG: hypothetical protein M5U28_43525 [Sandaracinaceae bacterium]|nr:hypothetical protein [Sandaracinaceae bacterium]
MSFTTAAPPTVVTNAATSVSSSSAILNGAGNPNRAATTGYFRYSTTSPGTCNDTFGSRAPVSGGTNLGSGSSSVAFSQSISGLSPGTTYYFCAIASSAEGTAFGSVLSFTTLASPTVTTNAATLVTSSSALLNGDVNPNGATTTAWYRYATTNPGACNGTFGTATTSTSVGAGTSPVSIPRSITGLTPNTTYYYCAIANNAYGTSYGAVLSFTTLPAAPTAVTNSATLVTGTTAQLRGSGNPGGDATTGWFRYATVSPGTCNDSFGTRAPASGGSSLGSGTSSTSFNQDITGLTPNTTYWYCAITQNSVGMAFGTVVPFTTAAPPTVVTNAATSVSSSSAILNGAGNPNRAATTGYFRYSTTSPGTCNDTFGSRAPVSGGTNLGSGSSSVAFSQSISGLSPGTTYYFCAIASSAEGTAFGSVLSFTTLAAPTVTTNAATLVTSSSASLNGAVNPNGATTTAWYRYATTNPGACNGTFGTATTSTSVGAGTSPVSIPRSITGLTPNTTYYYCAIANNAYGTSYGAVLSFTTLAAAPTAVTNSATLVTGTTAQLRGSGNPGGDATTGWFRYATASPGACNDSFGTRAPATGGSSLGSGTTSTSFNQDITGLTPNTTYYYCAITQNSVGMAFGSVVSFTTPTVPTVVTNAATSVTNSSAILNGSGNPNRATTTGYFRYSATNPGTCNDTFGSRAPVTGGTSLGSGTSSVAFSQTISGLSSGATYYYCAIATSSEGTSFGAVLSFTTTALPSVTTNAATLVTSSSATLNGSADPNGASTTGWFRYATTNPGSCSDTFGTRVPTTSGTLLGAGTTDVAYSRPISGLTPGTTYYYCAIANNAVGTSFGLVQSFTTLAALPTVVTSAASGVTTTSATLNGSANPNGATTTGWFRIDTVSPGTCNDSFGTRVPSSAGSALGAGTTSVSFSQTASALTPGTTYYFCAIASNSVGTSFGTVRTFATPAPPTVATFAATPVMGTSATLNASADPNGYATTGWFRYSTTHPGSCNDTFGTRAPASSGSGLGSGTLPVSYSQALTGLSPATTYYFCAIASSSIGTSFGEVLSFTTPASGPTVTTAAASGIGPTAAVLNGSANPNGNATTGWFRYSTTNPGACNDTFGTRVPATGGTSLGSGNSPVPYSQPISGLTLGTTYYFCAIAQNGIATSVGTVLSFTTTVAPSVTTQPATAVSSTGATLNGSANPNGASSNGWFRYATTSPGSCNDTFGTRAPASGGTSLGSGTSAVAYTQALTGLAPGTTYYYCAIASSGSGTGFGAVVSFTTPAAPTVTTDPAAPVASTSATLNGSANPNGATTTGWFRYATSSPGTCNDTFGTRAPATGGATLGSGTSSVSFTQALTGLAPATTYYYCAIANNAAGTRFGAVLSFTTTALPTVTTESANGVSSAAATLNGSANPNLVATTGWFRYATSSPGTATTPSARARRLRRHDARRGLEPRGLLAVAHGPLARHDLLLLRHRLERGRHGLRLRAVVHHLGGAHRDHLGGHGALEHGRDAERLGEPEPLGGHRLVPLQHDQPRHLQRHLRHRHERHRARRGLERRGLLAGAHRPHPRRDLLLLRHRLERGGHALRRRDVVHHRRASDGHHRARDARGEHERDAQRLGEPERHGDERVVPLQHGRSRRVQRHLRHARAGQRRHLARLGLERHRLLAGAERPHAGRDLLLLRDRLELGGDELRLGALVHHLDGAVGHDRAGHGRDGHRRDAARLGDAEPRRHHGLVPLRRDRSGHLQRHLRDARAGERRHLARRRLEPGLVLSGPHRPRVGHHLLLLRDRLELGGDELRRGALLHHAGGAERDDGARHRAHEHGRHAERLGGSQRHRVERLVPLRHHQPRRVRRHLRHARTRERRHLARRRHEPRGLHAGADRPRAGHDLLLLRDRLERGGHELRRRAVLQHADGAVGDDGAGDGWCRARAPRSTAGRTRTGRPRPPGSATPRRTRAPATTPSAPARRPWSASPSATAPPRSTTRRRSPASPRAPPTTTARSPRAPRGRASAPCSRSPRRRRPR